ncbi:LuxR family maltose regulon positive regulatory protein [Kribbella orskensis]|uniref:LuxR family maltose regulon positive regulatory protein n=1 Tax=Kribbella orskensis TaxID=2512216 RepID=A0ABY2C0Q6_9ACTN|nr:LuxR family maltose regulon positive regulatory protein [Kribbella sp. VKM Ac-2500]TCO32388.1 LuxR family maltose regulon positive regulatory protein [Kribbella orskensis]
MLATKLARPRVPSSYVARPKINRLLDAGTCRPMTVVSAGAGWGKTLATASWAASGPTAGPVVWFSLDESDNNPVSFWSYLVTAIRSAVLIPRGNPLAELAPGLGSEDENFRLLRAGLTGLRAPVVIVLDDFQVLHEPIVLSRLSELLRHPPPQLRLVLLTRADPALPLHRLRMTEDLAEIRFPDLAFSVAEVSSLLAAEGLLVAPHEAQLLVDRTEGWPAGVRLAAFFLNGLEPGRTPADFAGDDQAVSDYLAAEVFENQPPELRRFLLRTSVAERLNSGLAEVLSDEPRGLQFLEMLEKSNAFVVGLGPDRQWYRYHPMLREMLHHRLAVDEPERLPGLHRRAALWFAENGHPLEALRQAAEAADWQLLGRLFVRQAMHLLVSSERTELDAILARIPSHLFADGPELALCAAGRLMFAGRHEDIQRQIDFAQARLGTTSPESRTPTYIAIRMLSLPPARVRGDIAAVMSAASDACEALAGPGLSMPAADQYRAVALGNLGTALLWSGRLADAEACLLDGLRVAEATRLDVARINVLAHLGLLAASSGRLQQAFGFAAQAVAAVEARGWAPMPQAATAYLALAMVHFQWNNLDDARRSLGEARTASAEVASTYAIGLAQARLDASVGRVDAAREELSRLRNEFAEWAPPVFIARWLAITEAEIDLAAGDPGTALTRFGSPADRTAPFAREQVCLARAFLARGAPHRAEEILARLRDESVERSAVVEVWLLTTLVAGRLREDNRAAEALGRALEAARPEGVRRPFLVLDPEQLPRLLTWLEHSGPDLTDFADELLVDMGLLRSPGAPAGAPAEPLTDRELIVLRYLPTMMTNAEIASELYVSVNTVKAHLKRIHRKLDVGSRRQAVHRARELGLLAE